MAHVTGEVFQENNQEVSNVKNSDLAVSTQEQLGIKQKTQFEIDCEGAITLEELREGLYKKIDELWQK